MYSVSSPTEPNKIKIRVAQCQYVRTVRENLFQKMIVIHVVVVALVLRTCFVVHLGSGKSAIEGKFDSDIKVQYTC